MDREIFKFIVPAKAENLSMVRLTTSAIASKSEFSIEKIEDLKVCISEICNIVIKSENNDVFNLEYSLGKDDIEISLMDFKMPENKIEDVEMSRMILSALIEDINISKDVIKIRLIV